MAQQKPRILCLHGSKSNNEITQFQLLGLGMHKLARTDLLHGPHPSSPLPGLEAFSCGPWYTWEGKDGTLNESLEALARYLRSHGPFDGVYGFSMGTVMVTLFSQPQIWKDRFGFDACPWKFAILVCGGGISCVPNFQSDSSINSIHLPSLHIQGKTDSYLEESKAIQDYWVEGERQTYMHAGGHEIDLQILVREPQLKTVLEEFMLENFF